MEAFSSGTPEKFEARRLVLAERVWKEMTENNSRECHKGIAHKKPVVERDD